MSTSSSETATPEYPTLTLDDREPAQLLEELVEYSHEVEVKHLLAGDFEGQSVIGEMILMCAGTVDREDSTVSRAKDSGFLHSVPMLSHFVRCFPKES